MSLAKAQKLKKLAFAALDRSKRGTTVRVDFNDLIDVCIAFEEAASGDYENLEFSNEILFQQVQSFRRILVQIADCVPVDSKAWNLCHAEYDPEFNVDPDVCLANIRGKQAD